VLPEAFVAVVALAGLYPRGVVGAVADLPPPDHDPAQARDAADRILEGAEYRWTDDRSLVERIGEWVADQVGRITAPFGVGAGGVPVWVGWLVLAVLFALVGLLIYRSRAGWRRNRLTGTAGSGRIVVSAGDEAIDWRAEVERCESQGRWRDALRARYRVLVRDLARRQVLGDLVGRTAGELVAEVTTAAPLASNAFAAATALFEATWYGGVAVGPDDRDRFVALADDVARAVDRRPAVPGRSG